MPSIREFFVKKKEPKKFKVNESYKHKLSKQVLREWFYGGCDDSNLLFFKPNRTCGVWFEYPIVKTDTCNSIEHNWDELWRNEWDEYVPTYDELVEKNIIPVAVVDVVLVHKGSPMWFIEICHTHPTPKEKIEKLRRLGVDNLIEIDAEWIMKQTKKPNHIKYKKLI